MNTLHRTITRLSASHDFGTPESGATAFISRMRLVAVSGAAVGALVLSSCGAIQEKIVEEGAERIVENETGENVEIDFDDDGSFSIDSDGGGFSVDDDGNIIVRDENGDVFEGQFDDDGVTVTDESGEQVLDIDVNEDGETAEITFDGEDGAGSFKTTTDIPDEWPDRINRPTGIDVEAGSVIDGDGALLISVTGSVADGAGWVNSYGSALVASGAEKIGAFESDGGAQAQYSLAEWAIVLTADGEMVSVSLFPAGS